MGASQAHVFARDSGIFGTGFGVHQDEWQCRFPWKNIFYPTAGWDNRRKRVVSSHALWLLFIKGPCTNNSDGHLKSQNLGQKSISDAVHRCDWNTLQWTRASRVSVTAESTFNGECRPVNVVNLISSRQEEYSWTALISQHVKCGQGTQALRLYEEMRTNRVQPSPRTFVALLKACSSLQDLQIARQIHAEVVANGFESDLYVGTMLVDMYAKCGSLVDSRHAFDKLPSRDVVSWTVMISGYSQMKKGEEALQLYTQMQQEGVVPDSQTYVSALKACSTIADKSEGGSTGLKERCLEIARAIHTDIVKAKFDSDAFVSTMLVDTYVKCRSLDAARQVFEKMPRRDVVSWNVMILGYAEMNKGEEGLQLYNRMLQESVSPDCRTYVSALKACSALAPVLERNKIDDMHVERDNFTANITVANCAVPHTALKTMANCAERKEGDVAVKSWGLETVSAIHVEVVKRKWESNMFIGNMLVDVYAKFGRLEQARWVFEEMPRHDIVSWNSMISGYAHMDMGEEALGLYSRMQSKGLVPDGRTYVSALKACSTMAESARTNEESGIAVEDRCREIVRAIHKDIRKRKFDSDVFVGNMLVDVYSKCGCLEDARCVFEKMPCRDIISWNAMISGYAQMHNGEEALQLCTRMQMECMVPTARTYVSALKACSSLAELEEGNEGDGSSVKRRCLDTVRSIHTAVVRARLESDIFVANILVDVYAKCGSLDDAMSVFEKMSKRDVVTWTAVISGYAQMNKGEEALLLYTRMLKEGVVPDSRTYVAALNACGTVAGLEKGKEIHSQILKGGRNSIDIFVTDSLIDMYSKCGSMADAQQLFDATLRREIVAWNALIWGYANQGESELVFDLIHRMKHEGIQPNSITFLGVLTVCSHVGLVEMGQQYFKAMSRDYGITPTIQHFTCIIDLLGRAGHLDKAMGIVKAMPFQPHSALWRCILGACLKWGYVDLGRQVFECAINVNKDDGAAYVLMSNIYASAHMHEAAKQMQAMRVKLQARKQPGRSTWTDESGHSHSFAVGDQQLPRSQEIYAKLEDLRVKMKVEGYVPYLGEDF